VFVFIPIIPEMLERLQVDLQISEGQNEEVDLALNDHLIIFLSDKNMMSEVEALFKSS